MTHTQAAPAIMQSQQHNAAHNAAQHYSQYYNNYYANYMQIIIIVMEHIDMKYIFDLIEMTSD